MRYETPSTASRKGRAHKTHPPPEKKNEVLCAPAVVLTEAAICKAGRLPPPAALDEVCEGCHLKFWYPGQHIPLFPDQAPET